MNDQELQQAFIQFLAQKSGAKTEQELNQYIQSLGEEGIKQAQQEFVSLMKQQSQDQKKKKTRKAAHGSKLQYFKKLKNKCSEGEELVYYKRGGAVDCGCVKKAESGTQIPKGEEGIVSKFKRKAKELIKGKKEEPKKKDLSTKPDENGEYTMKDGTIVITKKGQQYRESLEDKNIEKKEKAYFQGKDYHKKYSKGSKIKVSC